MNIKSLHEATLGDVFWTADGTLRARVECRIGQTDMYQCSVFDADGRLLYTSNYFDNGVPTRGDVIKGTLVFKSALPAATVSVDEPVHGVAATSGHCDSNGGLRGHSVGDVFPYIPFFKGNKGDDPWDVSQWVRTPSGVELGPFHSLDAMRAAIAYDMIPKATFSGYHHLVIWNECDYESYTEAQLHGAVYVTSETVDALGEGSEGGNGVYEVRDVVTTALACVGRADEIQVGILTDDGEYIDIDTFIDICNKEK